jgi:hypothetical protein
MARMAGRSWGVLVAAIGAFLLPSACGSTRSSAGPGEADGASQPTTEEPEALPGTDDAASPDVGVDDATVAADGDPVVDDAPSDVPACADPCRAPNGGFMVGCNKRFLYGVNYAWHSFADFGGYNKLGEEAGVSSLSSTIQGQLQEIKDHGANVTRWWMFPTLNDAFTYTNGAPDGLRPKTILDIEEALSIADSVGIDLQFCIFSFDTFKVKNTKPGNQLMKAILADPALRAQLQIAVQQMVATVQASPYKARVTSWDVINEPEWAINGSDPYGDSAFTPNADVTTVPFADMENLVKDTLATLRTTSTAPATIGSAAYTWVKAWTRVRLDFYTFHMYDWINQYYPYTKPPSAFGATGKPVVLGEFPVAGLRNVPYDTLLTTIFNNGYAGSFAWAMTDPSFNWPAHADSVKAWADAHPCVTSFQDAPASSDP